MANRRLFGAVMLVAVWVSAGMAQAEGFGGTYALTKEEKLHILTLELDASGAVQGQMVGPGPLLYLLGEQEGAGISGMAGTEYGEMFGFAAQLDEGGGEIHVKIFPLDEWGAPDFEAARSHVFTRQSEEEMPSSESTPSEPSSVDAGERTVRINRETLSTARVQELEAKYGTRIPDGRYWYDASCGGWGVEDGPTAGFILPGLDLPGPMPPDISGGGTGIFINGREIHVQDQKALQQIFGMTIPGRYWLDAQGNLGPEGGMAIANLRLAAQAAAGKQYGTTTGMGGTVGMDGEGGAMFSGRTATGKSVFWYSGQ